MSMRFGNESIGGLHNSYFSGMAAGARSEQLVEGVRMGNGRKPKAQRLFLYILLVIPCKSYPYRENIRVAIQGSCNYDQSKKYSTYLELFTR